MQDAFEDWMDLEARGVAGDWFDGKVAGISHRNPDGRSRQEIARTLAPYDELEIRPEPANPFDPNAMALFTDAGDQVGYLEARLASDLARHFRRGKQARCIVRALRSRGEHCGISFGLLHFGSR